MLWEVRIERMPELLKYNSTKFILSINLKSHFVVIKSS